MLISLPPEIFDPVVEQLHEGWETLEACSVVSKPWVPRTRRYLFARVKFTNEPSVESWVEAFPDPSDSPAHHTRNSWIRGTPGVIVTTTAAHAWFRTFYSIVRLTVETDTWDDTQTSLVPLHALSSTLRFFSLVRGSIPSSEILNFICSVPCLEDLSLVERSIPS